MKIALIQMTSGSDITQNLTFLEQQIRAAVQNGAVFVATPENSDFMSEDKSFVAAHTFDESQHPYLPVFQSLAKELSVWILLGSIKIKAEAGKRSNRSYLFSDQGEVCASYDKVHLFDVDLPTGEVRRESDTVQPGERAVIVQSNIGQLGLSICYDVSFPYLYRMLAQAGAEILTVPAAFTVPTGQMHWEVLLRARAIENGAYVLAPAQCGTHDGGRKTYGHSMVIDPWGKVIAEAGEEPTILYVDIDQKEIARFRQAIPSLRHERPIVR